MESFDPRPHTLQPGDVQMPVIEHEQSNLRQLDKVPILLEAELTHWQVGFTQRSLEDPRIHTTRISPQQAVALKLLSTSLNQQGARMSNERFVQSAADALRYILDQIVDQVPAPLMEELVAEL
ncbi:MAG: hypothetical protein DWQ31_16665 [Planctomycetota bacterium]|nr:MAG: hypothetical protein DWQ31_16665 [Planctomycetota bacterium]